jgi:hypothetical protein
MAAAIVAMTSFAGCSSGSGSTDACVSDRQFFQREVWGRFMGQTCTRCHTPGGPAVDANARFVLQPTSYPNFIDANMAMLKEMSKYEYDGKPLLLQKPIGNAGHGGGVVLQQGDTNWNSLKTMIARLNGTPTECTSQNSILSNVTLLSPADTFRKAALDLGGRLPTADENAAIAAGGETALDTALDTLLKEDAFYDRLREWYNDIILSDRALQNNSGALNFVDDTLFPALAPFNDQMNQLYNDPRKPLINKALAREPLDLIAYVVKNERPFTEIVAAPYTVVNPYSAIAYASNVQFKDPTDYNEFHETTVTEVNVGQMKKTTQLPHAGVLSSPSFLNRWQTTPTNRDRGRARRVFQFFLATDVLKIAERPIDASQLTAIDNPTRNSVYCNVCHKTIDPVAGGFRGFDDQDYEEFDGSLDWHNDMELPGFGDQKMDPSFYPKAAQWLGKAVSEDPRFGISAVQTAYYGLTGRKPLTYPNDPSVQHYADRIEAWEAQDEFFRKVVDKWASSNKNFKVVVKAIIESPYYRGVGWSLGGDPDTLAARLADIGVGQLLSPEMLNRKIAAIFGSHWRKGYDYANPHDWLLEDYDILYGGIDSDSVIVRTTVPNGLMANVALRMANEISCQVTAYDFVSAKAQRRLFTLVEKDQAPTPDAVDAIKQNIQHLHELILGEHLELGDAEISRTYQIFFDSWKEYDAASGDDNLVCAARNDPVTGANLPANQQINTDKSGVIRAWQAVVAYLVSDWKFLHQ